MIRTLAFQNLLFNLALALSVASNAFYIMRYFFSTRAYLYSTPTGYPLFFDGRQIVIHVAVVVGAVGATFLFEKSANPEYASIWIISIFCLAKCIFEISLFKKTEEFKTKHLE